MYQETQAWWLAWKKIVNQKTFSFFLVLYKSFKKHLTLSTENFKNLFSYFNVNAYVHG